MSRFSIEGVVIVDPLRSRRLRRVWHSIDRCYVAAYEKFEGITVVVRKVWGIGLVQDRHNRFHHARTPVGADSLAWSS